MTRSMKSSYTGNLFQLVRIFPHTLNVGQVHKAADLSEHLCLLLEHWKYRLQHRRTVYGQINEKNPTLPYLHLESFTSGLCYR